MKNIPEELIANAQNSVPVAKEKGLEDADVKWDDIEGYALKLGVSPAKVLMKYIGEDIKTLDIEDDFKRYGLIEKQARTALDIIRLSKDSEDTGTGKAVFILKGVSTD